MAIVNFLVSEPAPFACRRGQDVSFVQLNILNRVPKTQLVHSHASSYVSSHLHDWHRVNKNLSIRAVSLDR